MKENWFSIVKKGIILTNAFTHISSAEYQAVRLCEEFSRMNIDVCHKKNREYPCMIDGGNIVNEYSQYDFCVYLDKDKYIAQILEKSGLRLFNTSSAIAVCDDKMLTHIALSENGIPMPKTVPGALCYHPDGVIEDSMPERLISLLGLPMIVKESYGSMGKGIYLVKTKDELIRSMEKLKCMPHVFQRFVKESSGKDVRIIVIGGKYLCAMERKNENDYRSNIELGATGTAIQPSDEYIAFAEKCAKILKLDYCGIDILHGENGGMICEVNSNAFFGGMEKATGINVARAYAEYIIESI